MGATTAMVEVEMATGFRASRDSTRRASRRARCVRWRALSRPSLAWKDICASFRCRCRRPMCSRKTLHRQRCRRRSRYTVSHCSQVPCATWLPSRLGCLLCRRSYPACRFQPIMAVGSPRSNFGPTMRRPRCPTRCGCRCRRVRARRRSQRRRGGRSPRTGGDRPCHHPWRSRQRRLDHHAGRRADRREQPSRGQDLCRRR